MKTANIIISLLLFINLPKLYSQFEEFYIPRFMPSMGFAFLGGDPDISSNIFGWQYGFVMASTNYGDSWQIIMQVKDGNFNSIAIKDDFIFLCSNEAICYISSDYCKNWEILNPHADEDNSVLSQFNCVQIFDNEILVATDRGAYRSLDSGKTWKNLIKTDTGDLGRSRTLKVDALIKFDKTICFTLANLGIVYSINNGDSWNTNGKLTGELFINQNGIYTWYRDTPNSLYISTDTLKTWNLIYTDYFQYPIFCNNFLYAEFNDSMLIYANTNNFSEKKVWNFGFDKSLHPSSYLISGDYFYIATSSINYGQRFFRAKLTDCQISETDVIEKPIQYNFTISPNPAESFISLNFPSEYQTSQIKIYSVEGILVYQTSDILKMSDVAAK